MYARSDRFPGSVGAEEGKGEGRATGVWADLEEHLILGGELAVNKDRAEQFKGRLHGCQLFSWGVVHQRVHGHFPAAARPPICARASTSRRECSHLALILFARFETRNIEGRSGRR